MTIDEEKYFRSERINEIAIVALMV